MAPLSNLTPSHWSLKSHTSQRAYANVRVMHRAFLYVCIYRVQNVFLRCPTPRLHCFLSFHWPSLRFLSFMAFFIPSIHFFSGLPRAPFCFGIHFNAIFGQSLFCHSLNMAIPCDNHIQIFTSIHNYSCY